MTKLRSDNPVLVYGKYELIDKEDQDVYAFSRILDQEKFIVLLNFSSENSSLSNPEIDNKKEVLINNHQGISIDGNTVDLLPYQALVLKDT
ncbi:MAG: hypothetical protein HKN16_12915 [Saprospiraceae bacterium]|nr:hypothetical protein [Saprospiraceae bacterium]